MRDEATSQWWRRINVGHRKNGKTKRAPPCASLAISSPILRRHCKTLLPPYESPVRPMDLGFFISPIIVEGELIVRKCDPCFLSGDSIAVPLFIAVRTASTIIRTHKHTHRLAFWV